jgi:hypothetical protein
MNTNKFQNYFNFPSLENSKLGQILEMKRIEEVLKPTKEKLNFTPKLFKKSLNTKILTLKKYNLELNSIFKNKGLDITNKALLNSINQENNPSLVNLNKISNNSNPACVNNTISQDLLKNSSFKNNLNFSSTGAGLALPIELYSTQPNLDNSDSNRILQLNFNRIIKHMNIFSKFDSELYTYQNVEYKFNNSSKYSNSNINSILQSTFLPMFSLIGKPYFYKSANKVELRLDFFRGKSNIINTNKLGALDFNSKDIQPQLIEKFNLLGNVLVNIFNKPVNLELNRLHVPFTNSTILSKVIGRFSKTRKYKRILDNLLRVARFKSPRSLKTYKENETISNIQSKSMIPSFMCGLKVRVGGRLLTQSVVPRRTVSIYQRGCLARGKANFVNTARFTNKNKRGAYSITVSIANLFN